jgi:hypothetical protein
LARSFCSFCSGLTLWISVIGELTEGKALRSVTTLGEFFDHTANCWVDAVQQQLRLGR